MPKEVTTLGETPKRSNLTIPPILKLWPVKVESIGEDMSFLHVLRKSFLTGILKDWSGAMEENKGRFDRMLLLMQRWFNKAAMGQSSLE